MTTKTLRDISSFDIKPGDKIVAADRARDYFTVEREATDHPEGTVVDVAGNRFFRSTKGWVGRSGITYTLEQMQTELNSRAVKVVLSA